MTVIVHESGLPSEKFTWSLEHYHAAIEAGIFTENHKIELIFGQLINKMPIGTPHARCLEIIQEYFRDTFGKEFRYRSENPVTLPPNSEPEPDFVISKRYPRNASPGHPKPPEIYIIIEVAHSTLERDRKLKSTLYAMVNVPEYWIINLNARSVELHLNPSVEEGRYNDITSHYEDGKFLSPLAGETVVADLLPAGADD